MSNPEMVNYVPIGGDRLDVLFTYQKELMERLGVQTCRSSITQRELTRLTLPIAFALLDEVHEFMRELPWKPWKAGPMEINGLAMEMELIDCWFFLIELSIMWGLTPEKVFKLYKEKLKINHDRQDKGY